ncbi:MAG: hypothetical protein ACQEXJ_17935 [Myxococcota bacterium]
MAVFDSTTASPTAVEAMVRMAGRLEAGIDAVYYEDPDLVQVAAQPLTRHVDILGRSGGEVDVNHLRAQLRVLASRLERRLSRAARRRRLPWTFRTVRGEEGGGLPSIAREAELLLLHATGRPLAPHLQLRSPLSRATRELRGSVLTLHPRTGAGHAVAMVYAGTGLDRRALHHAADLSQHDGGSLRVVLATDDPEDTGRLREEVIRELRDAPVRVFLEATSPARALEHAIGHAREGLLVVAADNPTLATEDAWERVGDAPCSTLLVR